MRRPFFNKGIFKNTEHERPSRFFLPTFGMWFKTLPRRFLNKHPYHEWVMVQEPLAQAQQPTITWIGHSTFLIQVMGINILTDPIFFNLSPFFRRNVPPGIALADLPPIDVVLISHNHWDHMHGPSLMALRDKLRTHNGRILVPEGDQHWFMSRGFNRVTACTWGAQEAIGREGLESVIKISFLPAWHWSRRSLFDRNRSLWGSWMIEAAGKTIYFAGDTAYADHFLEISKAFPSIDIALLPVGPCEPKKIMQHTHLDAAQAGQAFLDLNAQHFIPMHWGVFNFGSDHFLTPVERVRQWWHEQSMEGARCVIFKIGQRRAF